MSDIRIKKWVEIAVQNEDLIDYTFQVQGKTNKDDGYLGNITFVTVTGETKNGNKNRLNFVIKSSKESDNLRNEVPVKEVFEKEIYIYDLVIKAFEDFQKEKGIKNLVQITPRCYATRKTGVNELLVLEDLKPLGYRLWDRKVPMPFDHIKMTLETFGKWHAMSFALKKEKPNTFKKLTENNVNMFSEWFAKIKMFDYLWENFNKSKQNLSLSDNEILKKINFSKDEVKYALVDLFFEEPENHVILHGDCWTNNMLFKYENDSLKPLEMRLIDWQCSGKGSPVIDLSYFLYLCCGHENLKNFKKLLEIYYYSLSQQLQQLEIDPKEVYSYDTLIKQWKRFSIYGIIISAFIMRFSLCEAEEAPDFAEAAERGVNFLESCDFTSKNEDIYLERMKHNLLHYVEYA